MKKLLLYAAIILPRIYLMDVELQKELGLVDSEPILFEYSYTGSMELASDLDSTASPDNIVFISEKMR